MAQGVGPEFKFQYHKKEKKKSFFGADGYKLLQVLTVTPSPL
jgi:hypothetical protein